MNSNGSDFWTLFDFVVEDVKNRMNERDSYRVQFTTRVIFYSQKDNEELEPIHYHSYSWIFNKNSDIDQSHLNSNHRNIHTLVIENTPRSGLQFERVDGIDYRMTRLPNYVGGTYKELPEFVKNKKACINIKNNDNKCFLWSILAYLHPANDRNVDRLSKYKPYKKRIQHYRDY